MADANTAQQPAKASNLPPPVGRFLPVCILDEGV